EALPHELLDQIRLLIRAARRGDAADRATAVLVLDAPELLRHMGERLFPRHLAPGIRDLFTDHGVEDAVLMGGIAVGEAALHAGMAAIGLALLVGHHAHHSLALHLRLEGAADAAIGACGDRGPFGHAEFD